MIRVAVGAICNSNGEVLIARRSSEQHQGDLWEFPGGKIEEGESTQQALVRELGEELGITPTGIEPLIYLEHDYGDKQVALDVQRVASFEGVPFGAEGQPVRWVPVSVLGQFEFPAANKPIINALVLPDLVAVSSEELSEEGVGRFLQKACLKGASFVYLRHHVGLSASSYLRMCKMARIKCEEAGILLATNPVDGVAQSPIVHLKAKDLYSFERTRFQQALFVGASCHSLEEVSHAERVGCDYAFLSPVRETPCHPDAQAIGVRDFQSITKQAKLPIYALGGMSIEDLKVMKSYGAQGVAGISIFG